MSKTGRRYRLYAGSKPALAPFGLISLIGKTIGRSYDIGSNPI